MKLAYSPASPFARKIRIAAMELGLFDKIEFVVPIKAIPGHRERGVCAQRQPAAENSGADPR